MGTPLNKRSPIWLAKQDPNDPLLSPSYRRSVRYFRQLYKAWPDWCAEHPGFKEVKDEWKARTAAELLAALGTTYPAENRGDFFV